MELVKQQSLPDSKRSGCFLFAGGGDPLWAEHVICNPYACETEGETGCGEGGRGSEESWRRQVNPNAQEEEEEEEEEDNSMLNIQEEKHAAGGDPVRAVWRRLLSLWLRRRYANKPPTSSKDASRKPPDGFWRWLSLRHLLLQSASGRPHLAASNHLHVCHVVSSPVMLGNRCFLDDGELSLSPHEERGAGRRLQEARLSSVGLPVSDARHGERTQGSCLMFRAFHRCTAPELRLHFGEESDSDLEELLVEDEAGSEGGDTG